MQVRDKAFHFFGTTDFSSLPAVALVFNSGLLVVRLFVLVLLQYQTLCSAFEASTESQYFLQHHFSLSFRRLYT